VTRWAVLTAALYVLLLVLVTVPFGVLAMLPDDPSRLDVVQLLEIFLTWPYWLLIGVLALAQALLLVVPVKTRRDIRLRPRHILAPLLCAGLAMGILLGGVLFALLAAVLGDKVPETAAWSAIAAIPLGWVFWFFVFRGFVRAGPEPDAWMARITKTLHDGSTLELLVAVACHIVVRRRGDCSAPILTFLAMAAGIAVMFLSYGPGVFYLFAERKKRMLSRRRREAARLDAEKSP